MCKVPRTDLDSRKRYWASFRPVWCEPSCFNSCIVLQVRGGLKQKMGHKSIAPLRVAASDHLTGPTALSQCSPHAPQPQSPSRLSSRFEFVARSHSQLKARTRTTMSFGNTGYRTGGTRGGRDREYMFEFNFCVALLTSLNFPFPQNFHGRT